MALTPEQIAGFQAAAEEIAAPVVEWLLRDITERVKLAGEMTSTAAYEAYRAQALGESKKALKAYLKKQLQVSEKEAQALLEAAASFAQEDDYAQVGVWATEADGASLARLTAAAVKQAGEQLENLTGTLGMTSPRTGQPLPLQKVYRECMDEALKLVSAGAATASEAARQATRQLAGRGVVSIDYASGVSTELGAAVRRNLMGGMGQLVEQVTQMDHDELGCNGWEISAHANSAPDHEPIQGRQYSDAEFKRLNESLARRIGTLNCGHVAMPVILGVDSPQYTQSELDAFREENARGVTWEGRHMMGYEATQYQNRIERGIRRQEHRVLMSEAAGDEEQLLHDRVKLTRLNQEYARFNKAMGFKSRAERLEVVGWGRRQAGKARASAKAHHAEWLKSIGAENTELNTLAKYYDGKYNKFPEYELLKGYNAAVEKGDISPLVGFDVYKDTSQKIQHVIVGEKTSTGVKIESFSTHFIDRVIGQVAEPHPGKRTGVSVEMALAALQNPVKLGEIRTMGESDARQTFFGEKATVTIAVNDGRLIQTNPRGGKS